MILSNILKVHPRIITKITRRTSKPELDFPNVYLSLGHKSPEEAYRQPLIDGVVDIEDILADDWYIVE